MPFDGSGTFTRIMNWTADAAAGVKIKADRHDAQDDDIAAGLSQTITKDGQTQVSSDIPFNGHRITDVGQPTAPQDASTKKYVDDKFGETLTISGADDAGRIVFSGSQAPLATGKPIGFSYTQADLFFGVKPLDIESVGKLPRWVWNNQGDGMGVDVAEMDETGKMTLKGAIAAIGIVEAKATTGNVHFWLKGPGGEDRGVIYTTADVAGHVTLRVNGNRSFVFQTDGQFHAPGAVFAGQTAYLSTDANIGGTTTIWGNWGASDAFSAISARIESRASAWGLSHSNNCVQATRMAGLVSSAAIAPNGTTHLPSGYVVAGMNRDGSNNYSMLGRQPQVFIPTQGWVIAFPY